MNKNDPTVQKQDLISLADEDGVKPVLVNSVLGLWDVVNDLTRLRPSRRDRYRVTIFGRRGRSREHHYIWLSAQERKVRE